MTRCAVLHRRKVFKTFNKDGLDRHKKKQQKGTWKNGKRLSRNTDGGESLPALFFTPPTGVIFPSPLLTTASRSALSKTQRSVAESEWPGEIPVGRKWGRKALPVGWGATFPPSLTHPHSNPFLFRLPRYHPEVCQNHLTQLAMEHSPKTLPISKTSQEPKMPTKWRQRLSPFRGLFTISEPLPA